MFLGCASSLGSQVALAKKGLDLEDMQRKLDSLDYKTTSGPVEFFPDTDLEGYLESQHSKFIWSSIEETKQEVHLTRVRLTDLFRLLNMECISLQPD